ncbi:MAG: nucleotide sugar dehydrogenase [Ktedonobacteraceae bacterium]
MHISMFNVPNSSPTVAVVGLGRIGLPLAVQYARHGWSVVGCDSNPHVVESVNDGSSPILGEPELETGVLNMVATGRLSATVDTTEAVRQAAVVIVVVPVVVDARQEVAFAAVDNATAAIGAGLQPGTLVIYETTLPVGTTARRFRPLLERASHLQAGRDFNLAYSPERASSGHVFRDLRLYPKVVGGIDEQSAATARAFYRSVLEADILTMASTDEAEFVKLVEATYRDVTSALANEFACYAGACGVDAAASIAAANSQLYSHIHAAGSCISVYPYFLLTGVFDEPLPQLRMLIGSGT